MSNKNHVAKKSQQNHARHLAELKANLYSEINHALEHFGTKQGKKQKRFEFEIFYNLFTVLLSQY